MISKKMLGAGVACLAIAGTGVGMFHYQNHGTGTNSEHLKVGQEDPLAEILGKNPADNLKGDFLTNSPINKYTGPISETLQKCLDTPLTAADQADKKIFAPYNRAANITQTREEILADIGPVLGHAVKNNEINWKWDGLAKTYKFQGNDADAKLWYCYFKEDSPFFQEFLDENAVSAPFKDLTTVSFKEIFPEPAPDGGFKKPKSVMDKFHGMTGGMQELSHLKSFEDNVLNRIKAKFSIDGEKFEKFSRFAKLDENLISPKLGSLDFWDKIKSRQSEIQKVVKVTPEEVGKTIISLGEIEIDTTKEFSVQNLEQELAKKVKLEDLTDPITGREKILVKLSEAAVNQNADIPQYIKSLKLKPVGDELANLLDENAEPGKVKNAVATFELVAELADNVPAGTQFQSVIAGDIIPSVLNENGQTLSNAVKHPIFSDIVEIDGASDPTCTGIPTPVCGIESPEEALDAGHNEPQLKSYVNACEFEKAGAEFFDNGECDPKDIAKYSKEQEKIAKYLQKLGH